MRLTRSFLATLILSALALTLSACGGQPLVFNGNPVTSASEASSSEQTAESSSEQNSSEQASSEQNSSQASNTSASSLTSSSVASSSKSSSVSSSSVSGPTAAELYVSLQCSFCHGANGQGNGALGGELINCSRCSNLTTLTQYIDSDMPLGNPGACDANCAQKLGTYIFNNLSAVSSAELPSFLKQAAPTTTEFSLLTNNDSSCSVAYSENDLRPLTRQEYAEAILRLTGINLINNEQSIYNLLPPDNLVSAYYNNETIVIDSDTKRAYQNVASAISEQLYAENFAGIVDCNNNNSEACYNKLIDDIACKAFRRPLTTEERASYQSLFTGSNKDGIKNIINVLLSSPEFIYRSNIGLTLVNGATSNQGASLVDTSKTIRIYEKENLNASFAGNDVLEIAVKATQSPTGLWPVMRIQVGQATFVDLAIKHTDTQLYRLKIAGLKGNNSLTIINQQTGAAFEYQTGHNLVVSSVKLLGSD